MFRQRHRAERLQLCARRYPLSGSLSHEKGGVEGEGGWFRRTNRVPMPVVDSIEELNELLGALDDADGARRVGNRTNSVGHDWAFERTLLRPLPAEPFDTAYVDAGVDRYAQVMVRCNQHRVPAWFIDWGSPSARSPRPPPARVSPTSRTRASRCSPPRTPAAASSTAAPSSSWESWGTTSGTVAGGGTEVELFLSGPLGLPPSTTNRGLLLGTPVSTQIGLPPASPTYLCGRIMSSPGSADAIVT